jgi:D-cysteine desulfhydrase
MPAPDRVFVAAGTLGSAVGLAVGLRAAGLASQVVAVRASSTDYVNDRRLLSMAAATVALLRSHDPSFPEVRLGPADVRIEHGQVGGGYAMPTSKARRALDLVAAHAPIVLDETYTAKAFAAIIDAAPTLAEDVVLYWHTFDPTPMDTSGVRADELPLPLRGYAAAR